MANNLFENIETLALSAIEVKNLTNWPDEMVEDYINIIRNIIVTAQFSDELELRVDELEIRVTQNEIDIAALDVRVTQNEVDIAALTLRVEANELAIAALDARVTQNESDIADNAQDILYLEHRVFGEDRPAQYDEAAGYLFGDYVVNPADPNNYYQAIEDIPAPAGPFDPLLWWEKSLRNTVSEEFIREYPVIRGYGGIEQNAQTAVPNISATYQTLTIWDSNSIAEPKDITQSFATNSIAIDSEGVWSLTARVSLEFDEVNAGRIINLRLYNQTTATAGVTFPYFVGRNQGGFNLVIPPKIFEANPLVLGDEFVLQIGGGDNFTNVLALGGYFEATRISAVNTIV